MARHSLEHHATVPAMIGHFADRFGAHPQIIDDNGPLSFADVRQASERIARGLLADGLAKGARVGVLMNNGSDYLNAMFGIQRAGGVAVLISTFAKAQELAHMIRYGDLWALLAVDRYLGNDYVSRLEEALPSLAQATLGKPLRLAEAPYLRAIWLLGSRRPVWSVGGRGELERLAEEGGIDATLLAAAEREIAPADPALMIYTSGSTAEPKAVLHSHGTLVRQSHTMSGYMTYEPGDRLMTTQPFFWVGGLCTSLLAANHRGAALVCPADPTPTGMVDSIERHHVTHTALWPAQLAALAAEPGFERIAKRLKPNSAQQLATFGLAPPELTPNSLGMTETLGPHSMEYFGPPLPQDRAGSFGRAVGDIARKVVDPETGADLQAGSYGEIAVRGGSLMLGMHRKERAEVFAPDGFYRTGDLGRIDTDGYLFFEGRKGDMVKTSGANVAPREVELALLGEPEVQEAAVLGLPHPELGEELVAVIVARAGTAIDDTHLRARLRAKLSSYKVPRRFVFLGYDEMPRTGSDKVKKTALRDLIEARRAS